MSSPIDCFSQLSGSLPDLSQKIALLDELWLEIRSNYDARDRQLHTTLPLAEHFWTTSSETQALFKNLRAELNSLPDAAIETSSIEMQRGLLDRVKSQLAVATPQFEALHRNAAELLLNGRLLFDCPFNFPP